MLPAISASHWYNVPRPVTATELQNKVVLLYAFQMLCPLCITEATPLMNRVHEQIRHRDDVTLIGLHTVFEDHEAQAPDPLAHYVARAGITFPVAIDAFEPGHDAPITMRRLLIIGTPSIISIDRAGSVRERLFGVPSEKALMARVERLAAEPASVRAAH